MAYDPDEHGRLESLYLKYGSRLQSEARSVRENGHPQVAGHDLSEHYEDALATAHAVYAYLLAHPVDRPPGQGGASRAELGSAPYSAPAV